MFLNNIDTIKKRKLTYQDGDNFFLDDGKKYHFKDITSYYHIEIEHFTNSIYQGNELDLSLTFKDIEKPYIIHIKSNHEEKYKTVYKLSHGIANYREKYLMQNYNDTKELRFKSFSNDFDIVIKDQDIYVEYLNPIHNQGFKIEKIYLIDKHIELVGDKQKEKIAINQISDKLLFLKTIPEFIAMEFKVPFHIKVMAEVMPIFWILYFAYIILLGGSFLLHRFCCQEIPKNNYTEIAAVLLIFTVIMMLFGYITEPLEKRKRKREFENSTKET